MKLLMQLIDVLCRILSHNDDQVNELVFTSISNRLKN